MNDRNESSVDQAAKDKLDEILHPDTQARKFKITLEFGYKTSANYDKAVKLARKNSAYKEEGSGEWIRHSATYMPENVEDLFNLFNLIHQWESMDVFVNHKKIPYAHQLWLPMMWFYRIK